MTTETIETQLLKYVLINSKKNDLQDIINCIDKFCWNSHWMMNIGDVKGKYLDDAIKHKELKNVLELGTYCGYSCLRILNQLTTDAKFVTIEINPEFAKIARLILEHAGVADRVTMLEGSTYVMIPQLKKTVNIDSFDFIFVDHWKAAYLRDFQLLYQTNLGFGKSFSSLSFGEGWGEVLKK
jgi:catechol O-methyltransferase